jgi:Acyltransferase family
MSEAALSPSSKPSQNRLFGLDLLKALSITAVVSYHSVFLPQSVYTGSAMTLEVMFAPLRFCVPVLLTMSFLLMERGFGRNADMAKGVLIKKRLIRLAIPTGFWFALAAGLKLVTGNPIPELAITMLKGTIFYGAYFLLVLIQFLPLFIWFRSWFKDWRVVLLTLLLQGLIFIGIGQLLITPQASSAIAFLRAIDRPFVIYWFAYLGLGIYFWRNWDYLVSISKRIPNLLKIAILGICWASFSLEYDHLYAITKGLFPPFDYAILSCLLSVPILFLCFAAIQENQLSPPAQKLVSLLSKYSLGIFCINGILSQMLGSIAMHLFHGLTLGLMAILIVKFLGWSFLLGTSLGLSVAMDRLGMGAFVR